MTTSITIAEAQANLKEWLAKLAPGDQLLIVENDKPIAEVRLPPPAPAHPQFGIGAGWIVEYIDDDEHLKDFAEYM